MRVAFLTDRAQAESAGQCPRWTMGQQYIAEMLAALPPLEAKQHDDGRQDQLE